MYSTKAAAIKTKQKMYVVTLFQLSEVKIK
jgi:hypothetical protein